MSLSLAVECEDSLRCSHPRYHEQEYLRQVAYPVPTTLELPCGVQLTFSESRILTSPAASRCSMLRTLLYT